MSERHIHQLGDGDAIFVAVENERAPSHIGGLTLIDGRGREGFGFEHMVERIEQRIALVPRFGWKLHEVPFGLDRPYFVEDERFDARAHVHRIALAGEGSLRDLHDLAALLHARPLDRSRPLWEAWWIEGLADGRVAMLIKMHHCLVDGEGGVGLTEILMDLSPDAEQPLVPVEMQERAPVAPEPADVATRAAQNALTRSSRLFGHGLSALRSLGEQWLGDPMTRYAPTSAEVPRADFNDVVGPRRAFASASVSLETVRELKKHFDVTVNDVLLELVGASLRRSLRERGALPERSLVACCPVSHRKSGDKTLDNQIGAMSVSIATDLADPAQRLKAINRSASHAKEKVTRGGFDLMTAVGEVLVPKALELLTAVGDVALDRMPLPGNFVFSNVRGLPVPVYMAGARVDAMFPMSMLQVGNGLNVTAVSYMDRIDFGFLVDPDLVDDPQDLADGIPVALEALQAAAEGVLHAER